ncbi:hypothetical protein AGLY_017499 [Aphis glycines]|uniref:DUF8207 domain-containing protein n=1 Tax=Aphis glycines TaxID=307491 RepID=A0A6G0SWN7_APHGL|nr:hypothetical protein AGLY_017499 [Aphis glycines]
MKFVDQQIKLTVENVDPPTTRELRHGALLPNTCRALVVGPSGCEDDSTVLNELVIAKENIKRKFEALKRGDADIQSYVSKTFEPIIKPLNKLHNQSPTPQTSEAGNDNDISNAIEDLATDNRKELSGHEEVKFKNNEIIINASSYQLTPGLVELLFSRYTDSDLNTYKSILIQTSAHLTLDGTKIKQGGAKYKQIICKLFSSGTGVQLQTHNLVYWNDPNELVDRLRLLLASQSAGNTGVSNEILSIFEELYESDNYNNSKHRTIGMTPVQAEENPALVTLKQRTIVNRKVKFHVGDKVRISTQKGVFTKGFLPNWSTEIFTIVKINKTEPPTYQLHDYHDEPIAADTETWTHQHFILKHISLKQDAKSRSVNNWLERLQHGLSLEYGDIEYGEIQKIFQSLTFDRIYVKGLQKQKIIEKFMPHATVFNIENLECPRLCQLNGDFG